MVMMRYVLCILALLLSCACVHVLAEEVPAADLSDQVPDTESETKILLTPTDGKCPDGTELPDGKICPATSAGPPPPPPPPPPLPGAKANSSDRCPAGHTPSNDETCKPASPAGVSPSPPVGGGKDCTSEKTDPPCSTSGREHEDARADDCVTSSDRESCPDNDGDTQEQCPPTSGKICPPTPTAHVPEQPVKGPGEIGNNQQDLNSENSLPAADGHGNGAPGNKADAGSAAGTGGVADGRTSTSEAATPAAPAPAASTAGNSDAPSENPQHANNEPRETAPSPTTPSSRSSATASDGGSNPASTENDNTPSGSESTNNQEGVASNTDTTTTTTTTTTTLPPELTNNKKGDADSSSSISSSVWVRVPLLIVVTLACILVC